VAQIARLTARQGRLLRSLAVPVFATVLVCAGCATSSGPSAAERYETAVAGYNQVIRETEQLIQAGSFRPAFVSLAQAEDEFASALDTIEFPDGAAAPVASLTEVSRRLASLYREAVAETDESALRQTFERINAARAQATRLSRQVRAALGE
jgi:hypothetical protein